MKLGEILISEGHLTQEGLEEALDWQVLYGGRLGTNLLELKLVEEQHLARGLGRQLGVEVAWGELQVDPDMLGLVPKHVADRSELVPWKMEKRRIKVLCTEPARLELVDELSRRTGHIVQLVVAPEFRMFQLLRKHYQATRQMRALDFGVVPVERENLRRRRERQKHGWVEEAPELIDEGAFQEIYAQVLEGRSPVEQPGPVDQVDMGAAVAQSVSEVAGPADSLLEAPTYSGYSGPRPPPLPAISPRPPPRAQVAPPAESLPDDAILGEGQVLEAEVLEAPAPRGHDTPTVEMEPVAQQPLIAQSRPQQGDWMHPPEATGMRAVAWDAPPPEPPPRPEEPPLAFDEAVAALAGVTDRNAIAHIVLRTARSKARRALLLQVQGNVALGWDGLGEGLENGLARAVAVPLTLPSAFQLVVKSRSHFLGPLQKTPINIRFLAQLGKKVPLSSLLLPILHRERVSHLLYLDNGHKQHAPSDVGEMLILSQRIAQSVAALVERKRRMARG